MLRHTSTASLRVKGGMPRKAIDTPINPITAGKKKKTKAPSAPASEVVAYVEGAEISLAEIDESIHFWAAAWMSTCALGEMSSAVMK